MACRRGEGLTVSLGVAPTAASGGGAEQLMAAADAALYEAKRAGRNRVRMAGTQTRPAQWEAIT